MPIISEPSTDVAGDFCDAIAIGEIPSAGAALVTVGSRPLLEVAIGLEGAEVGILFRGLTPGEGTKMSMRSKSAFDVAAVCTARGGGGHKKASGCTVKDDDLARVRAELTAEVAAALAATPRG